MNGKEHPPIKIIWLINSLEYETAAELIAELQEMKEKYPGQVSSISIENFVNNFVSVV